MLGRKCWHCDKRDWQCVLWEFWKPCLQGLLWAIPGAILFACMLKLWALYWG